MVLIGAITWVRGILLFIIQIVGGIVAAEIVQALFQGDLAVSTTLGGGTTIAQGVIIEMILTAQLVFTIFMLAAEKHTGNFIAPVGIGLSLFIAELTGTYIYTHASFNQLWNWIRKLFELILICSLQRRLLDRRLPQPSAVIRSCGRCPPFPHHAMDILGRSDCWLPLRSPDLQACQIARIRECESRP